MEEAKNSQTEANKRWQESNRERTRYLRNRSTSRSFIKKQATEADLNELQDLINERKKDLVGIEKDSENNTEKLIDKLI
ncbi:hypothetical protein IGK74_002408 [Enterococcus sp. AZ150]|uniref:hypothetical protein n=1 Tax=Enterococcus sp. AZ150 TaxID=2774866 RepID=UPI003F22C5F2